MSYASDHIKQNKLTAGRKAFLARAILATATAKNLPDIAARCALLEQAALDEYNTARAWAIISAGGATLEGAATLDQRLDAAVAAPAAMCQTIIDAAARGASSPLASAAQLLLKRCYPLGVRAITQLTYVDQVTAMRTLLAEAAEQEVAEAAAQLGVTHFFDIIAADIDTYEAVVKRQTHPITYRDVELTSDQAHEELCELIILILAATPGAPNQPLRAELLDPIKIQTDAQRDQRRLKLAPTDLNPKTGAEEPAIPIAADPNR